jgi:hypothetical protein
MEKNKYWLGWSHMLYWFFWCGMSFIAAHCISFITLFILSGSFYESWDFSYDEFCGSFFSQKKFYSVIVPIVIFAMAFTGDLIYTFYHTFYRQNSIFKGKKEMRVILCKITFRYIIISLYFLYFMFFIQESPSIYMFIIRILSFILIWIIIFYIKYKSIKFSLLKNEEEAGIEVEVVNA